MWWVGIVKDKDGKIEIRIRIINDIFSHTGWEVIRKMKTSLTKTEDLQIIELNPLLVYDNRSIKTKIRSYGDNIYSNFWSLSVPEDAARCESFMIISIDSLLYYENKHYLQVYLNNCVYKISDK